jgi:4-hydroxybenzoate polyprenyltransferase
VKKQLNGLIRLTRYQEYVNFVIFTTLLGAAVAHGYLGWKLVGILAANYLVVAFAFMINDVEDAPDDALDPAKAKRNPVSAADLSPRAGRVASFGVALVAAMVYALLGFWPFVTGLSCLVIAYMYSWRRVRLKSRPFVDLVSHGLMLAGLQYLAACFTFEPVPSSSWVFPFLFVVAISMYGELFNELRDLSGDREAGITHTANLVGQRATYWLMIGLLLTGIVSALVSIFILHLIPLWIFPLWVILAALLMLPNLVRLRQHPTLIARQASFHRPAEMAGAFSLLFLFILPRAAQFFSFPFFKVF